MALPVLPIAPAAVSNVVGAWQARAATLPAAPSAPVVLRRPTPRTVIQAGTYAPTDVILAIGPNTKRPGTEAYLAFSLYYVGMPVSEYLADKNRQLTKGRAAAALRWDIERGLIQVGPASALADAPAPAADPAPTPAPAADPADPAVAQAVVDKIIADLLAECPPV